jgi:hypothetical protein
MIESDGKNERQLIEWAQVEEYLQTVIVQRARTPSYLWLKETDETALVIWLLWLTASRGKWYNIGIFYELKTPRC